MELSKCKVNLKEHQFIKFAVKRSKVGHFLKSYTKHVEKVKKVANIVDLSTTSVNSQELKMFNLHKKN